MRSSHGVLPRDRARFSPSRPLRPQLSRHRCRARARASVSKARGEGKRRLATHDASIPNLATAFSMLLALTFESDRGRCGSAEILLRFSSVSPTGMMRRRPSGFFADRSTPQTAPEKSQTCGLKRRDQSRKFTSQTSVQKARHRARAAARRKRRTSRARIAAAS